MRFVKFVHLAFAPILLAGVVFYAADRAAAQGSEAVRQACTQDAMRLCSDVIPDVARITACMKAKSAQVSQGCKVAMRAEGKGGRHYHGHYHHHRYSHHHSS
jgi:hypothetical protein